MLSTQTIKEYAYSLGFDIARVTSSDDFPEAERVIKERIAQGLMDGLPWFTSERADVSCHPDALLPEARSIISLAMTYLVPDEPEQQGDRKGLPYTLTMREDVGEALAVSLPANDANETLRGRISRYAWGDDYHDIIKPKLQQFAEWLRAYARDEMGEAVETRLFVDTGRMVDRAVAQRAGLGWYGKNTNILTKGWGSWVFLAEIVTNLPLEEDTPLKANCGSCELCLHACPTSALPNAYELDTPRCISFLTIELRGSIPLELRPLMGNLIFGCDICQEVCPVNKVAEKRLGVHNGTQFRHQVVFQPRNAIGRNPDLISLLALTEEEFRERFRRSPIKRTKRRGLLRNVCVALGNSHDMRAVPALINALYDNESLIRGHAAWALGQIGGEEAIYALHKAEEIEEDSEVRKEIAYALEYSHSNYS